MRSRGRPMLRTATLGYSVVTSTGNKFNAVASDTITRLDNPLHVQSAAAESPSVDLESRGLGPADHTDAHSYAPLSSSRTVASSSMPGGRVSGSTPVLGRVSPSVPAAASTRGPPPQKMFPRMFPAIVLEQFPGDTFGNTSVAEALTRTIPSGSATTTSPSQRSSAFTSPSQRSASSISGDMDAITNGVPGDSPLGARRGGREGPTI